jgi:hypothetical protein
VHELKIATLATTALRLRNHVIKRRRELRSQAFTQRAFSREAMTVERALLALANRRFDRARAFDRRSELRKVMERTLDVNVELRGTVLSA